MAGPRLWVMSDLHLETGRRWRPSRRPEFDALVVAGDVRQGDVAAAVAWVAEVADGRPAAMVLGNHEFWGLTAQDAREEARRLCEDSGVTLLDGQGWVPLAGAHFIGCTLWTDQRLNRGTDQQPCGGTTFNECIDWRGAGIDRRAKVRDILRWHDEDVAGLERALAAPPAGTRVVVTHHAPHPGSIAPAWRAHPGASMAASDLRHLVACEGADLWIHGHVHASVDICPEGRTRILCNPSGPDGSNPRFDEGLVVTPTQD